MKQHATENTVTTVKLPALLGNHSVTDNEMIMLKNFFMNWYAIDTIQNLYIEYKLVNNCDVYRMVMNAVFPVKGKSYTVPGYFCTKWVVSVSHSNVYYSLIDEMKTLLANMSTKLHPYVATKGVTRMGKPKIKRRWIIG